jgi:hypothetical protein
VAPMPWYFFCGGAAAARGGGGIVFFFFFVFFFWCGELVVGVFGGRVGWEMGSFGDV